MGTVISTIGEAKRYINSFPPEADDYPFQVASSEGSFPSLEGFVVANCDGHPDYAMIVVEEWEYDRVR